MLRPAGSDVDPAIFPTSAISSPSSTTRATGSCGRSRRASTGSASTASTSCSCTTPTTTRTTRSTARSRRCSSSATRASCGAIGCGMNQHEMLERFVARVDLDCVLLAGRYSLLDRSGAALLDAVRGARRRRDPRRRVQQRRAASIPTRTRPTTTSAARTTVLEAARRYEQLAACARGHAPRRRAAVRDASPRRHDRARRRTARRRDHVRRGMHTAAHPGRPLGRARNAPAARCVRYLQGFGEPIARVWSGPHQARSRGGLRRVHRGHAFTRSSHHVRRRRHRDRVRQ